MSFWDNRSEMSATYIRKGGPGNRWKLLDIGGSGVEAMTGGAADVESRFGLDAKGNRQYLGAMVQGDAARFTTSAMFRLESTRLLEQLRKGNCPFDLFVQQRCGEIGALNYTWGLMYYDGYTTNKSTDSALALLVDNAQTNLMRQLDLSLAPIEDAGLKLVHRDISGTVSDFGYNDIINVGIARCAGDCGAVGENDGEQEFWSVTDADNTPGHGGTAAPTFKYTEDGGTTWGSSSIQVLLGANAHANAVAKAGQYVIVVGETGIAYAKFQDIKDGVPNPWVLALSAAALNDVVYVGGDTLWACGDAGVIYKSGDGGFSWSAVTSPTVQNLFSVAFVDNTTVYFAGAAGTLIQYFNGTLSLIVVRTSVGGAAITATFNKVACAPLRGNEVYIGTATGLMYRSTNALGSYVLFSLMTGLPLSGSGSIADLAFAGYKGSVLFIVQTNPAGTSRVLRDISGGATAVVNGVVEGMQIEEVGGFTSPSNFGINSIAPASITRALTVGEIHETYGFIGSVLASGA
jgi:hypothetical protein